MVRDFGRRPGMENEIELNGSAVYTVRDGKVARAEFFAQQSDGYRAVGLEPPRR